jgi:hypothetical protein
MRAYMHCTYSIHLMPWSHMAAPVVACLAPPRTQLSAYVSLRHALGINNIGR